MDYDFWLRISKHYKIHYVKKPLATIRVHDRAKSSPGYEVFEREWFRVSKQYWGNLFSLSYYKYIFNALNFRSNLMRINAYSKIEELSPREFRRKIFFAIASNPLNLLKRNFFSAFLRTILGHEYANRVNRFLR